MPSQQLRSFGVGRSMTGNVARYRSVNTRIVPWIPGHAMIGCHAARTERTCLEGNPVWTAALATTGLLLLLRESLDS